jgi:hypothetical protein
LHRLSIRYLALKARETLYNLPKKELEAMRTGFDKIFPQNLKSLLTARELGTLVCGESRLNAMDWQSNTSHRKISQVDGTGIELLLFLF